MHQEDGRKRLRAILGLIDPGISVRVEETVLVSAFGRQDMIAKAEKFARDNQCAMRIENSDACGDGTAHFGRAYYREL